MADSNSRHATLISVQVGLPETVPGGEPESSGKAWTSGIFKFPVDGPLWLGSQNLEGDGQADLVHHGGVHKAVCVYSADHFPAWHRELGGRIFQAGAFGENFTIAGLTERDICIGDIWEIGDAQVQVSQPRQPCWKLARRWHIKELAMRMQQSGRTGWYFRVLREGVVACGGRMRLVERPHVEWTVERANHVMHHDKNNLEEAQRLANVPLLSPTWRKSLHDRVQRNTQPNLQERLIGPERPEITRPKGVTVSRARALPDEARMNCDLVTSVPDWVIDYPATELVFKELGIDVSCEGKSLEYVCRQHGLNPEDVFGRLHAAIKQARTPE
jgi:MOSC domain-containing protein YiiM